jgi:hypothetical protein
VRVWLIAPPDSVKAGARELQSAFGELEWIAPVPDHYLHVSVAVTDELDGTSAARAWADVAPFPIVYRRTNCFHDAPIVEAHTDGVAALVRRALPDHDLTTLLPHMSIGYTRQSEFPDRLRSALRPVRDVELGTGLADEVLLCDVPAAKSTFLEPWRVLASVKLQS